MRFSLAANYDLNVVDALGDYPVEEVYGKRAADAVGGGRPSYMGQRVSWKDLAAYVSALDRRGIAFNYLINSPCQGNREWGRRWQRRFMNLMERLQTIGVRHVTVSTPYLLETVKARFPDVQVRVGIFAQIDTPSRARFWEDLGADTLTLESFSINRNLERLGRIREAVGCRLQLIANHLCLPNCAMQPYHQNGFAHSSSGGGRLFIDYCVLRCARRRLQTPALFLKSAWIRPEDVPVYENLGIDSLKLLERDMPSEDMLRRVRAYAEQRFDGNLADLLLSYGFQAQPRRGKLWGLRHFVKPWDAFPTRLRPLLDLARAQGMLFPKQDAPVVIDNQALPADFLRRVSDCSGARGESCGPCDVCERMARDAVRVDETFRRDSLERFAEVERTLKSGSLWGV